jgi:hypothetical protein
MLKLKLYHLLKSSLVKLIYKCYWHIKVKDLVLKNYKSEYIVNKKAILILLE